MCRLLFILCLSAFPFLSLSQKLFPSTFYIFHLSINISIYLPFHFLSFYSIFFLAQCLTFYLNQNKQALFLFLLNTSFLLFAFTFQTKRSKGATSFSHSGLRFSQIIKRSRLKIWLLAKRTPLQFLGTRVVFRFC